MAARRDLYLDGLRAVSVLRVISLHLMQRVEHPFVAVFSFMMPGMPLMFFVSGALAAQSLGKEGNGIRARFWRERGRRLLLPFWAFGLVVVATCLFGALTEGGATNAMPLERAWAWALPLVGPQASPAHERLVWHLWFLSSLIVMLATAPWTLALHRRVPWVGALSFFAIGAACEIADVPLPGVVRNTLLFGSAFQLGFAYSDGRIFRVPRSVLIALVAGLAAFALAFYFRRAPGEMLHAVPLALVALGLAAVGVWLLVRERVTKLFERARPTACIRAINGRAYTLYLWGPVANEIGWAWIRPKTGAGYVLDFLVSIAVLVALARVFAPVEAWAARRTKKPAVAPSLAPRLETPLERADQKSDRAAA